MLAGLKIGEKQQQGAQRYIAKRANVTRNVDTTIIPPIEEVRRTYV